MREVRQTRERSNKCHHEGPEEGPFRELPKKSGMPLKVFAQGGYIITIYSSRINLALLCEWFEGEGTKEGENS